MTGQPRVSIIIKTKNEERNIETAIKSALAGLAEIGGEVIVADSASTDRTIEIARRYPIKIAQISKPEQACCGIGPQLGYQYSSGDFVCIMDADQTLDQSFVGEAVRYLEAHSNVAGVTGIKTETNFTNTESKMREQRHRRATMGPIDSLNDLGFYRRSAIADVSYFSDPNLHAYEEFELGTRLRVKGWQLHRIEAQAILHRGHDEGDYKLLVKRWRSGYAFGSGELVRAAVGAPHFRLVMRLRQLRLWAAVLAWWLAVLILPVIIQTKTGLALALTLLITPPLIMAIKRRSISGGIYAIAAWTVFSAGLVVGLLRPRRSPRLPVEALMLKDG